MRDRRQAALVVVLAVVTLGSALACTGDDEGRPDPSAAPGTVDGEPGRAPEVFGRPEPGGWSWVGATDDALVGLGGSPAGTEAYGQAVDLATGAGRDLDPLPDVDGREVEETAVAFRADDVVVTGFVPPDGGMPPGTDRPPDVEAVSFLLDPSDGSWTVLDGPDLAVGIGFSARLEPGAGDGVVVGTFHRAYGTGTARARLDGDRWEPVVDTPDGGAGPWDPTCATATDVWEGVQDDDDGTWVGVVATPLDGGATRPVAIPGLRSPSGGLRLACASGLVVFGQMQGAETVAVLTATTDDGETWTDLVDALPEGRVVLGREGVPGGDHGLVVRARLVEPGADGQRDEGTSDASLVVGPDGTAVALDVEEMSTPVVWRGRTGELLALEPDGDTAAIRTIDLP